ncbi:MAG: hypothetical protein ACOX6T_24835 [Myxococcales bacterium]|jgi:hypothetical protein
MHCPARFLFASLAACLWIGCGEGDPVAPGADAAQSADAAAPSDAGLDAGRLDASAEDAGADAGGEDAAIDDAGLEDAGFEDAGVEDAGADAGIDFPDLAQGEWVLEQLSETPGTISHDGLIAFTEDGTGWAAWAEPDSEDLMDQDIWVARQAAATWQAEPRTKETGVQMAFPTLAARGSIVHLAFSGAPAGNNAIFYSRNDGSGWSSNVDLTSSFESGEPRSNVQPSLAVAADGSVAIAYASRPAATNKREVRVLRLDATGAPLGEPETIIPAPAEGHCYVSAATFDSAGKLHVVADCGLIFAEVIYYATDASGTWQLETWSTPDRDDTNPKIAAGPDGSVSVVWLGSPPCATASGTCGEIFLRTIREGVPGPEINATNTGDISESAPAFTVDPFGRPIVAFHVMNAQRYADIFVTWADDGVTFAEPRLLTPGTEAQDDWMPWSIAIHPETGLPHVLYTTILGGTNPLNSEIMHARLELE